MRDKMSVVFFECTQCMCVCVCMWSLDDLFSSGLFSGYVHQVQIISLADSLQDYFCPHRSQFQRSGTRGDFQSDCVSEAFSAFICICSFWWWPVKSCFEGLRGCDNWCLKITQQIFTTPPERRICCSDLFSIMFYVCLSFSSVSASPRTIDPNESIIVIQ